MAELVLMQEVAAPAEQVFAVLTDWSVHDRWMLFTHAEGDRVEGGEIRAFTGVGRLGFLDTMEITAWEPPHRCDVRHTGRLVRGTGSFEVRAAGDTSVFVWSEDLELPLGALGRAGWPLVRPLFLLGLRRSLDRFARWAVSSR